MTALFLLLTVFLYFFNLGLNAVWIPNEAFYADASRRMLETGDFLTPVYNGEPRLNKPPMTYWLTALSFWLFGVNEFGLRFFQALLGLLTGLLTYLTARELGLKRESALLSALAFNLSFIVVANSRYTSPEVPLTFFITLSLYLWLLYWRRGKGLYFWLALTASAFAVLTKGPAGFALPAGVIFFYLLFERPKELLKLRYYAGTLYVFLLSGWWFLYQYLVHREEFLKVFIKENVKRIYALQSDPFYQYLLDVNVSFLPYAFLVFPAVAWAFKVRELRFPLVWTVFVFGLFSAVKMKIPVYVMPAYPALALLTGAFLTEEKWEKLKKFSYFFLWALTLVALLLSAYLFELNLLWLALGLLLSLLPFLRRRLYLLPAGAGFALLLYLAAVLLPFAETKRPYREVGKAVISADPYGRLPFYELPYFHHNLPFYARRVVIRNAKKEELKRPSLVLSPEGFLSCGKVLGRWELYTRSESRFFKFLLDVKRGKNFKEFTLCLYE